MKTKIKSNKDNKWIPVIITKIVSQYIRKFTESRDSFSEILDLVDQIYQSVFVTNLKNSSKLVTNSAPFLASFELMALVC